MQRLPVDINTFSALRLSNYIYVDKTQYMYHMITEGRRYFLSRPRRFGKSLLVSTLKEILIGNKQLFEGLWIASSDYQWQEYGVINLDFSQLSTDNYQSFITSLNYILCKCAQSYTFDLSEYHQPELILDKLVSNLHQKYGPVAILVDEYDSPLLKTLSDQPFAKEIRNKIQHFFTVIKSLDAYVQFVFITGVSSFAKAGLFSGINNLQILTLREQYATICGYTDHEIDTYFKEHISAWSQKSGISYEDLREQIKSWYNGYSFGYNVPKVYNPFSVMNALNIQQFENFWFQSGTPTFLVDALKKDYTNFDPEELEASQDFLGIFDVDYIPMLALMFQAGYLTITSYNPNSRLYTLDYPNQEVRVAFQKYLLEVFAHVDAAKAGQLSLKLYAAFEDENIERVVELLQQLFGHIPYQLHVKQEKFYHSLLLMICVGAGIKVHAEYSTSHGRIDAVFELTHIIYVVEIKFNDTPENALLQIEERRYYERFLSDKRHITLLGFAFTRKPNVFEISYVVKKLK